MKKTKLFGISIDNITLSEAIKVIVKYTQKGRKGYVVTPNVDHVIRYNNDPAFRKVYNKANFTFTDGAPLILVSKFKKDKIAERIAGADLFVKLLPVANKNKFSIFLLGSEENVNLKGFNKIKQSHPDIKIGRYSPKVGFEKDPLENKKIIDKINKIKPNFLFVFLSSPKQEYWISKNIDKLDINLAFGFGASLDFYTGKFKRAPKIFQNLALEWIWRMLSDPKRLAKRYLIDNLFPFAILSIKEVFKK